MEKKEKDYDYTPVNKELDLIKPWVFQWLHFYCNSKRQNKVIVFSRTELVIILVYCSFVIRICYYFFNNSNSHSFDTQKLKQKQFCREIAQSIIMFAMYK